MKVAFLLQTFSVRGAETSIYNYAIYNQKILKNRSIIVCPDNIRDKRLYTGELLYTKDVEDRFKKIGIVYYPSESGITNNSNINNNNNSDNINNINNTLTKNGCDVLYILKSGENDGLFDRCNISIPVIVHCVFTCNEDNRHGDVYASVSESINKCNNPIVLPHICIPIQNIGNIRSSFNIPDDSIVFGRHGGYESFDIDFVKDVIRKVVNERSDIYFIFLNTERFYTHKNIIYLNKTSDIVLKTSFINLCDAMIHARQIGESFGLSIAEFTSVGKPIITWKHQGEKYPNEDIHHIKVLGDSGVYYTDEYDLYDIFTNFNRYRSKIPVNYSTMYTPEIVMKQFNNILEKCIGRDCV
jgi:hypothetical protein